MAKTTKEKSPNQRSEPVTITGQWRDSRSDPYTVSHSWTERESEKGGSPNYSSRSFPNGKPSQTGAPSPKTSQSGSGRKTADKKTTSRKNGSKSWGASGSYIKGKIG